MDSSYNLGLVALSVVISITASYAALDLAGRVTSAVGRSRLLWLTGGATAMGFGIWSMHYIGMLAFHLPVPVQYDWPTVVLSLLAAIFASAVALFVVSRREMGLSRAMVGSLFMGAGIAAMHYTGMAAMRLPATHHYSSPLVTLSVALAMVISFVALWLTFRFRGDTAAWGWMKVTSGLVMGVAIPVMHYTGMAAASFTASAAVDPSFLSHAVSITSLGTTSIVAATVIVLGLVLLTSLVDQQFSAHISGRQQAEAALVDSERTYGITFDAVPIGIAHMTLDFRWLRINDRLCELLGSSRERLLDSDLVSLTHPDDVAETVEARRQLAAGSIDRYVQQKRYRRGNGQYMWASVTVNANRNAAGARTHFVTIVEDITERRNLEEQFRQAQKMEAIGQLAGGMAHDFNNILACILGYAELVAAEMPASDPMRENLDEVIKGSQRAKELVLQILTFSRQQVVERRPMSLFPVVKEALKFVRALLPSTIDIEEHLDAAVPGVLADSTQIHQIIMNLATNAAHAMNRGGRLKIELAETSVDAALAKATSALRPGRYVRLSIGDSGCGMNAAIQQHIFEPFFTTKAPGEGTGLGLSVVHGIMSNHGGAITVWSAPDVGTTFTLYFPVEGTVAPAVAAEPAVSVRGHGEHILFVDDEPALASLGRKVLERGGYRVTAFTSPLEALAAFRAEPQSYDLVITDQTMPNLTGSALAGELLRIRPGVPIILTTGFSRLMTHEQAVALGIRGLLRKPVAAAILIDGVHRALRPRELVPPALAV